MRAEVCEVIDHFSVVGIAHPQIPAVGLDELVPDGIQSDSEAGTAVGDIVVAICHRHIADRELLFIFHSLIVDRNKKLQQSTQRPLIGIRRLHGVLQIGKAGLACPGMGVVKIRAVIQRAALEDRLIIFLADND